jgi:hypothetical protein
VNVSAYPSDTSVIVGTKFSIVLDITPKPGMHLYAPGADGYRVVSVNIEPQSHVRIEPARYPASEVYHFVPLDERVPVFQRPFTMLIEVVQEATREGRRAFADRDELVIMGTLDCQACDDELCYNPVSVPLSWNVMLAGRLD